MVKPSTKFKQVWRNITERCNNKLNVSYNRYGALGTKVHWKSFDEFEKDMFSSFLGHYYRNKGDTTIERKDNEKGYSKENCTWLTKKGQQQNKKNLLFIVINGQKKTLREWCCVYKITYATAWSRIKNSGMTPLQAVTTPILKTPKNMRGYYYKKDMKKYIVSIKILNVSTHIASVQTEKEAKNVIKELHKTITKFKKNYVSNY